MTHVVQQIADAIVETIRQAVPELQAVYKFGTPPSGRRKFPVATVVPGGVDVETQLSGNRRSGRVQTRVLELGVAITAETSDSSDYASGLTDIAAKIEKALAGWQDLPVEDVRFTADSGVQDEREDGEVAAFAGIGMTFEIRFFTVEGNSTAFIEPEF